MRFEAITIKDIAKALGISTSTVSRALRDSYEISPETKALVLECAERLNYKPNPAALSLKERRTRSIGVIVSEIANSFFSQIINGIESIAYNKGYNVIITQSHESFEREMANLNFLASRSVDGLLVSVSTETHDMTHFKELLDRGFPMVFVDRVGEEMNTPTVMLDNFRATYDATEHLIQNGYKNIAALATSEFLSNTTERLNGYKEALMAHDITPNPDYIRHCYFGGFEEQEVEEAINKIYTLPQKPDAILCMSDRLTIGCLRTLARRRVKIPNEMAVVGFSNSPISELINPPLTIVHQPATEMGKAATELLLQLVESKRPIREFERRVLSPELIIRESSLPRKK